MGSELNTKLDVMNNKNDTKEKLEILKSWFKENPKLPEEINPTLLKRFFKCTGMDVEETKKLIEHNYFLRNKSAKIFTERDPIDNVTKKSYHSVEKVPLPGLTADNMKVLCFRIVNKDPSAQNTIEESKCFFMMNDVRFTYSDLTDDYSDNDDEDVDMSSLASGEIHILDISNYTLRHLATMSLMVMRSYMNYMQEAYPVRLKAMHVINCPSYLNRMVAITKPFIREEVFKLFHFHTEGMETLYEHVPRDMLPADYGGNSACLSDISANWWNIVVENRDYIMDAKHWKIAKAATQGRWYWW